MGAQLQALLSLQDIEYQIVDIERQLKRKERQVAAQQQRLDAAKQAAESKKEAMQRSQMEFDRLDVEVKGRTEEINKLRDHLNSVRTNKEYAAVLAQLNNEKADVTRLEQRAMELMGSVEQLKSEFDGTQSQQREELERLEDLQAQYEKARGGFEDRLKQLEAQRNEAAAVVEASVLQLFDRLSERYDGEVLAEVERPNPRLDEFVCTGCHMMLRPEIANALKTKDDVITCKTCGRILHIQQHT